MKIHTNDNVKIIAGKDKGKTGKVIQVFEKEKMVVIENINKITRHLKRQRSTETGQRIEVNAPIAASNVQLVCPKCKKTTRIRHKTSEAGKKTRVCHRCKETIS